MPAQFRPAHRKDSLRIRILAGLAVVALSTTCGLAQTNGTAPPLPDVYLVTIDTLRADHVHCYGYDRILTPALDSLALNGIRFAQAFTPSPITNTSHASILTGLLPSVHGVSDFGVPLDKNYPTWAELLKENGYQTAAFIGAVVLDSHTLAPGLDRGFDFYDNFPSAPNSGTHWGRVERRGGDVVQRAETWMTAHQEGSRFVWIHLYDPHDPYDPPAPYSQLYRGHLYDGEIAYADHALLNFLAYLKRDHRYRNALIVVIGDHGEGLGEHGEATHGIFLYDATTHVPLIFKLPTGTRKYIQTGQVVNAQVQTTDILPTVLDLLGIAPTSGLSNRSLSKYFSNPDGKSVPVFGETDYPLRFGWAPLRAIRDGGYKFIEAPKPELYNLAKDPRELANLYEPWNSTVQQLRAEVASSAMRPPRVSVSTGAANKTTLSELRSLGYLGPGDEQTSTNVPELSSLPDPKDKIEEQNLLHSAMMAVDQGHSVQAHALFEEVLQLDPDSPAALRQIGELELQAGQYRPAADHLDHARKIAGGDAAAAFLEGRALYRLGDLQATHDILEAGLTRSPGEVDARILLAEVDTQLGKRRAAEDQLEAALLLNPESNPAELKLAKLYLEDKQFDQAIALLEPSSKKASTGADTLLLLMQAYAGAGRPIDADRVRARIKSLRHHP